MRSNGTVHFPRRNYGQPGVTSLCVMAFVAQGYMPGEGPYGDQLDQSTQVSSSIASEKTVCSHWCCPTESVFLGTSRIDDQYSPAVYNHALSSLLLSEVFAMGGGDLEKNQEVIELAVQGNTRNAGLAETQQVGRGRMALCESLTTNRWQLRFRSLELLVGN